MCYNKQENLENVGKDMKEGNFIMKNYYSTIDGIVFTFSDIEEDKDGFDSISFRFERPNDTGFDFAEGKLPENRVYRCYGFSEDELMQMEEYLKDNNFLIWEIARERSGKQNA